MWNSDYESSYLAHHGILGQKWGVRRFQNEDGTRTEAGKKRYNDNYSSQQRTRDRKFYGDRAVERINKRMNQGESISSARHNEVVRKERIQSAKNIGKAVAKGALVIGGAAAVTAILQKKGLANTVSGDIMTGEIINVGRQVINAMFR